MNLIETKIFRCLLCGWVGQISRAAAVASAAVAGVTLPADDAAPLLPPSGRRRLRQQRRTVNGRTG